MKIGISKKITGAFLIGICAYTVSIGMTYLVINDFIKVTREMDITARKVNLAGDLKFYINKLLGPVNDYLITGKVEERDRFDFLINKTSEIFKKLEGYKGSSAWKLTADKVKKDAIKFGAMAVDILFIEDPMGNRMAAGLIRELNTFSEGLIKEADEFHNIAKANVERMTNEVEKKRKVVQSLLIIILVIAFVSLVPISLYLKRFITTPILKLHDGARIIGSGKLDHRLHIKTGDEIESLAEGFNLMATSLEDAQRKLDREILELYTLYNISKTLSTTFEMEKLLNQVVERVSQTLKLHSINVMLVDENSRELYIVTSMGINEKVKEVRYKVGEGVYGLVALTGQAEIINDLPRHPRFKPIQGFDDDASSLICAPFKGKDKVIGIINGYRLGEEKFDEASFELLVTVATQVGMALENVRLFEETKVLSITDGMTSLYNYRYFMEHLNEEFERAKRYKRSLSVIMVDVDFFKKYNDANGHPKGDELLRKVAEIFKRTARISDTVARYGGEEFVVILPETCGEMAFGMAERLRKEVEANDFEGGKTQPGGRVTISLGVASYPEVTDSCEGIIKCADDALYRAKEEGRNRACM